MVPPSVYRPRPAGQIEESNITASRFLGGVRRKWMTGPQNAPVASGLPARDGRVRKGSRSQTVPTPAAPDPAPAESVRSGPEVTLMSPVTPGSTLPPAALLQTSQVTIANKPSDPPAAALPSPVPSTDSHPSPIVSPGVPSRTPDATPQTSESPIVVAQPADSETTTRPQPSSRPEDGQEQRYDTTRTAPALLSEPVPLSESRRATPVQAPLHIATNRDHVLSPAARQSPYQSPSGASTALSQLQVNTPTEERRSLQAPDPQAQSSGLNQLNDDTWQQWRANLEQLKAESRNSPSPITWPRVMLLEAALEFRDLLYLVLHQVYCRRSVDGRILSEYPALQQESCLRGMDKLSDLLEDNAKIPRHTVWSFADFPSKLEDLRHEAWFPAKIQDVARLTYSVSTHLFRRRAEIAQAIYARGYPPLAQEMRMEFQVGSTVFLTVIFSSMCRELYTDDKVKELETMFRQDIIISAHFLEARRQNMLQQQSALKQQIDRLVEAYKKIPMRPRPSPALANFFHPASGSQAQAMPTHVTGPPSAVSQPSVASPMGSAFAHAPTTSNSPQAMMAQTPGYFQHPFTHLSQLQQIERQQMQQMQLQQQMQMQSPQQWQQAVQIGSFHPAVPPQEQSTLSSPMQRVPQRRSQPAYAAHQSAQRGQAQRAIQEQRHQSISSPTQPVAPSQVPPAHWPAQVAQQQGPQLSDSSRVNMTAQRRASQRAPLQSPHGQPGPQTTVPLRQVPLRATQGPSVPYPSRRGSLIPPADYRPPQTVTPNPMRLGLHQADLRDPVKKLLKKGPSGEWIEADLYHFHGDFLLTPQLIDPNVLCYNWNFTLSEEDSVRLPHVQELGEGQRPVRTFQPGCRSFRLRSVALRDSEVKDSQLLWPTKGTTWPSVFYLHVNGVEMFVRRKFHNGKDLPLDITKHLKRGENKVSAHFLLDDKECQNFKYFFGIERMLTTMFEHVESTVGTMSADETRRIIHKRLTPLSNDDDVAFITDNLTINLVDPFMAQIFKVPARSMQCTHLECFDLETFIRTRKSESGPTPFNDNWRCPICDADARPQCLRVDPFLVEVRDELIRTHRLETAQAIQVKADGTWALKVTQDESSVTPHQSRAASVTAKRKADSTPDPGPESSRPKTESSPDRNLIVYPQGREVIEID